MGQQESHLPASATCQQAPLLGLTHTLLYSQDLKLLCSHHMPGPYHGHREGQRDSSISSMP